MDTTLFPDMAAFVLSMHEAGVRVILWMTSMVCACVRRITADWGCSARALLRVHTNQSHAQFLFVCMCVYTPRLARLPQINTDSSNFAVAEASGFLVRNITNETCLMKWWHGKVRLLVCRRRLSLCFEQNPCVRRFTVNVESLREVEN